MSDSEVADTGDVPRVPTNIPFTEIATGAPENICTGGTGAENINTEGNTSITRTPGVSQGGNLSPRAFDTLIRDITPQQGERRSGVHSRGGTSVPRYSRGGGRTYHTRDDDFDGHQDSRVPRYSTRFEEEPREYTYETRRDIETLGRRISGISHNETGVTRSKFGVRAKLATPPIFEGKYTEVWNILNWILIVERYLFNCDVEEELYSNFAFTFLGVIAQAWFENRFLRDPMPPWEEATLALKSRYLPTDHVTRLLRKFVNTRQQRSLADYVDEYQILVSAMQLTGINKSETELVRQFIDGLSVYEDRMNMLVRKLGNMEEAYEPATMIRGARRTAAAQNSGAGPDYSASTVAHRNNSDRKKFNNMTNFKLSDSAKRKAKEDGACLECGKTGHWWRNCPDLKPKSHRLERGGKKPPRREKRVNKMAAEEPSEGEPEAEDVTQAEEEASGPESSNEGPDSSEGEE